MNTSVSSDRLLKLGEEVVNCLNCGEKSFRIRLFVYDVPHFGKVLLEVGTCDKCSFRRSDVSILEVSEPIRIVVKVTSDKELNALVVKSSTASIYIPELGIEITPGPAAPGYITTVEGILHRVLDHIPSECFDEKSHCYFKVKEIKDAIDGKIPFTLIIEDPFGRSDVKGEGANIVKERLNVKE